MPVASIAHNLARTREKARADPGLSVTRAQRAQYQPFDSEWFHAPHGVP